MTVYTATASRHDNWWVLDAAVPGAVVVTEVRRIEQAEAMLRDAIATALDIPSDSFDVTIDLELGPDIDAEVRAAREASRSAQLASKAASAAMRQAAHLLRERGYSMRDAGRLLEVSPQRVSQLLSD